MKKTEQEKKEKLGKLLLSYIAANILVESLDEDLIDKKLFQRQTKFNAKNLLESLEKDIAPLYKVLQSPENIAGYTGMFDLVSGYVKELQNEIIDKIEE